MTSNEKLSFSFAATKSSTNGTSKPMSNMEALMAKAKSASKPTSTSTTNIASTSRSTATNGKVAPSSIFGEPDSDDETNPASSSTSRRRPDILSAPSRPIAPPPTASSTSRSTNRALSSALTVDPNAFAYDEVYDSLKASEAAREAKRKAEAAQRAPKYIDSFLASAETRKLDRLRAEEKMLALEREKEGGEFDDKEKFVTEGYKKQMEEVRKAEAEEKKREEAIRKSGKGPGLSAFYKNMLDTQTAQHDTAIASAQAHGNAGPSLAIRPPTQPSYEPEDEYDPTLDRQARDESQARLPTVMIGEEDDPRRGSGVHGSGQQRAGLRPGTERGRPRLGPSLHDDDHNPLAPDEEEDDDDDTRVQINDDGEVVNKRTLLRAGLNITKKPSTLPSSLFAQSSFTANPNEPYVSRAVGTAASYAERKERERQRLAENMRLEAERKKREEEERYREEEEAAKRRREGDDGLAEKRRAEARERALERKRLREEGKGKEGDAKRAKV